MYHRESNLASQDSALRVHLVGRQLTAQLARGPEETRGAVERNHESQVERGITHATIAMQLSHSCYGHAASPARKV